MRKLISVVVPVYNEEKNIRELYLKLCEVFSGEQCDFEMICVDDGSKDQSLDVIRALHAKDGRVKGLSFSRNFGHQSAVKAGYDYAKGDAVICMDADLQHPPEMITQFLSEWRAGYDIVYTIREENKDATFIKRICGAVFYKVINCFLRVRVEDGAADFRLLDRKAVDALIQLPERALFLRGLIPWIGFRAKAIRYVAGSRLHGVSKYSWKKMFRLATNGVVSFSAVPLYLSVFVGIAIAGGALLYGLYVLWVKLFTPYTVKGWSSILFSVLFLGGMQLVSVGILGAYLAKIYEEVKQRPVYIVRETI
jgi:dolichol-phosphate mannosyltransferase